MNLMMPCKLVQPRRLLKQRSIRHVLLKNERQRLVLPRRPALLRRRRTVILMRRRTKILMRAVLPGKMKKSVYVHCMYTCPQLTLLCPQGWKCC